MHFRYILSHMPCAVSLSFSFRCDFFPLLFSYFLFFACFLAIFFRCGRRRRHRYYIYSCALPSSSSLSSSIVFGCSALVFDFMMLFIFAFASMDVLCFCRCCCCCGHRCCCFTALLLKCRRPFVYHWNVTVWFHFNFAHRSKDNFLFECTSSSCLILVIGESTEKKQNFYCVTSDNGDDGNDD